MHPVGSIPVTNAIGTTSETDTFPTHLAQLGKGGHRTVNTLTDLYAIPTERREFGMTVRVVNDNTNNGTYELSNILMGGVSDDLANNNNWKVVGVIQSTGDYYVHNSTGLDSTNSGSAIKPFKTIQYTINYLNGLGIYDANIKVLGGTYTFITGQYLHYRGTITFENGSIINVDKPQGEYLIDGSVFHYPVIIYGVVTIRFAWLVGNVFTKSPASLLKIDNGSYVSIQFKAIETAYYNTGTAPLIDFVGLGNLNLSDGKIWFSRLVGNDTAETAILNLFGNSNVLGSNISLINIDFSETLIALRNYNNDAGSSIEECSFYGNTRSFNGQSQYLQLGKAMNASRPISIINNYFDAVSLKDPDDYYNHTAAIILITEDFTKASFSGNKIGRKKDNTYAIRNQHTGVVVAMFNNIGVVPLLGADNGITEAIDEVNANQYIYDNSGIDGLRY